MVRAPHSERGLMLARILAPLPMKIAAGVIALLLACLPIAYFNGRSDGAEAVEDRYAAARTRALVQAREADAAASRRRIIDTERNRTHDEERIEAIAAAESGAPDAANRSLACERLRQAGLAPAAAGC